MPEICRFLGIVVRMQYGDHSLPHFHAVYGGAEAVYGIDSLTVLEGRLPPRVHGLVSEWASLHQTDSSTRQDAVFAANGTANSRSTS